jgi:hypothetical protein
VIPVNIFKAVQFYPSFVKPHCVIEILDVAWKMGFYS